MKDRLDQYRGDLVALAYFDLLRKPLNIRELRRFGWQADWEIGDLRKVLKQYRYEVDGVELYGLSEIDSLQVRGNQERVNEYWRWLKSKLWILRLVPFVELVMLMNGMAHGVVGSDSDIDLFVVTKPNRTWLVRGWMLMLLTIFRARANANRKAMRLSPEFFVSTRQMNVSKVGSSSKFLTSFWVSDFTPVVYTENFNLFWKANYWLSNNLPVAYRSPKKGWVVNDKKPIVIKLIESILKGSLGDRIEKKAMNRQREIILKNLTKMGTNPDYVLQPELIKVHFNSQRPKQVDEAIRKFMSGDSK